METYVASYNSHHEAVEAIKLLGENNFPMKNVSLIGKAEVIDDHIHVKSLDPIKNTPAVLGVGAGTIVGLLSGIGVFAIPGFGFLYGAGALVGAIGGFDLGLITGGLTTLLLTMGIKKDHAVKYHEHLKQGKFLVLIKGSSKEIKRAMETLELKE